MAEKGLMPTSAHSCSGLSSAVNPESLTAAKDSAERILNAYIPEDDNDDTVEFLRNLLDVLPHGGRLNIFNDIMDFDSRRRLRDLRNHVMSALILPMTSGGKTPDVTPDDAMDTSEVEVLQLKNDMLGREGFKCMATGLYDFHAASTLDEIPDDVPTADTECTHIIPYSLGAFDERELSRKDIIWDCLYKCFPDLYLRPDTINDPRNTMTMFSYLHAQFRAFRFSFEETDQANKYNLILYKMPTSARDFLPKSNTVEFVNHDPQFPLPDALLLRIHAAIARFLHMPGMAERVDAVLKERENTRALASNGSTNVSELLSY